MPPTHRHPKDGYFRHHGVMAPAVRLFRNIGFPAKAAFVSAGLVVPLVIALWALWSAAMGQVDFSRKELVGTAYVRPVLALIEAGQHRRRAASTEGSDLAGTVEKVGAAFERLERIERLHGATLGTGASFAKVADMHRALMDKPVLVSPKTTVDAHTAFIGALLTLLRDAGDGSNMTLDPDLDTYYLMDASVMQAPFLIEAMGGLRTNGTLVLREEVMGNAQRDAILTAHGAASINLLEMKLALDRAVKASPAVDQALKAAPALEAAGALLDAARQELLNERFRMSPDAYLKLANDAIHAQFRLVERTLDTLDAALDVRIAGLRQRLWTQVALSGLGALMAAYLFVAFYQVTRGGIVEVDEHLARMATGDLTGAPVPWGRDEAARLMTTLRGTIESLRSMVTQVRTASAEIETASSEIASASLDLSQRTEHTAGRLQETAGEMQNLGQTVRETAQVASETSGIVARNAQAATTGASVMREAAETMAGIRQASESIADIISTIDGIAFQTNILALNAAVEAARAGDAGRGFAVVASEVRALAQRTTSAARQVKDLVDSNRERVAGGTVVMDSAGKAMLDIVANAERIQQLIRRVDDATQQQTTGIASVEGAVHELETTTHQNAALVEQTSATAASLHTSAAKLAGEMAFFKLA